MFWGKGTAAQRHKHGVLFWPVTMTGICADCHCSVGGMGEWCMLKNKIWEKVWPGTAQRSVRDKMPMKHNLCIGCIEKRLGRRLNGRDFDMRINHNKPDDPRRQFPMSRRLRSRFASKTEPTATASAITGGLRYGALTIKPRAASPASPLA